MKLLKLIDKLGNWFCALPSMAGNWYCHKYHKQHHGWPNSGNQCCMKCARHWKHEWPGEGIGS